MKRALIKTNINNINKKQKIDNGVSFEKSNGILENNLEVLEENLEEGLKFSLIPLDIINNVIMLYVKNPLEVLLINKHYYKNIKIQIVKSSLMRSSILNKKIFDQIRYLNLDNNIYDISGYSLQNKTDLCFLKLDKNYKKITDNNLKNLKKIKFLEISTESITDNGLDDMINLKYLHLRNTSVIGNFLKNKSIEILRLSNNVFFDMNYLDNIKDSLEVLNIEVSWSINLNYEENLLNIFSKLTLLKKVSIEYNLCNGLKELIKRIPNLEYLKLTSINYNFDYSFIKDLKSLKGLNFVRTNFINEKAIINNMSFMKIYIKCDDCKNISKTFNKKIAIIRNLINKVIEIHGKESLNNVMFRQNNLGQLLGLHFLNCNWITEKFIMYYLKYVDILKVSFENCKFINIDILSKINVVNRFSKNRIIMINEYKKTNPNDNIEDIELKFKVDIKFDNLHKFVSIGFE